MLSNLEYCKSFYYVVKFGSITAAASALYISQPAVSLSIQKLEDELGCKLFTRMARGVRLTPEGDAFFKHIEKAFNEIESGERVLRDMLNFESGEIIIGASDMTMRYFLLPHLEKFHHLYPKIKITVSNAPTPDTIASLKSGKIDFGVVSTPFADSDDLDTIKVGELNDIFVAGEKYKFLMNKKLSFEDLAKLPIICLEKNTSTRKATDDFLLSKGAELSPEFELAQSDLIVEFAQRNMGIGSVVDLFAKEAIENKTLFRLQLEENLPTRNIAIVKTNRRPVSKAGQRLLEIIGI